MKTTKLNLLLLLLTLGVFAFSSCEDEFTEEDFLEMQAELAESQRAFDLEKLILEYSLIRENDSAAMVFQQQLQDYYQELEAAQEEDNIEALRQAGLLASYTITIEDQRGVPIQGATVSVGGSNTAGRFDVTSDATGQAIAEDIVIGASPVQVTAPGFIGVYYILDLGSIDYLYIGDKIYPLGRYETSRITLLSSDGANGTFTTITGTATIETDLRNSTPELPQGATVVAYVDGASGSGNFYQSSVSMYDFRFIGENIGSAIIDNTTGTFNMQLPANEVGIIYNLVYSEIVADQVLAIQSRDGVAVTPVYATVPTRFGPNAGSYDGVPSVPGAMVVFETPPVAGSGFGLTFTQVARPLFTAAPVDVTFNGVIEGSPDGNNTIFRLNNRGSGYSTSPSVVVDGGNGTGTDATIIASINGRITGLSASTFGTGYADGDLLTVTVTPRNAGGTNVMPDNDPLTFGIQDSFTFNVTVAGVSGTGALPATLTLPTGSNIGVNTDVQMGFGVASYNVSFTTNGVGTGAVLAVSSASATVDAIRFSNGGTDYTGPATIAISGGNGLGGTPTQASMSMGPMAFEYIIAANNTSASGYQVMPTLQYEYTSNTGTVVKTGNITAYESDNSTVTGTPTLNGSMQLSGGTIVFRNTGLSHRTLFTRTAPAADVVGAPSVTETATVNAINSTTGAVTNISFGFVGRGYSTQFGASIVPTIAGAPGSGASVSIPNGSFNFNATTGEVTYNGGNGFTLIGGSGYLPNLNRPTLTGFSAPGSISAVSGKTVLVEVVYGTGARTQVVN